jgi:hypothetical protein
VPNVDTNSPIICCDEIAVKTRNQKNPIDKDRQALKILTLAFYLNNYTTELQCVDRCRRMNFGSQILFDFNVAPASVNLVLISSASSLKRLLDWLSARCHQFFGFFQPRPATTSRTTINDV